ncbi:endolytic transglycosylase MltG [Candidatus Curtissbacteria bacterium]|nr:endolytic transglycosylase MltG [Candidatus Curtissbacteria bacterium]
MKKLSLKLKLIFALFILIICVPVALVFYYNSQLTAPSKSEEPKRFVVKPGQPLIQIANNLQSEGLIKNALAFRLLVAQMGITTKIQAGDYRLAANKSARALAQELVHGALDIWITFPEGERLEQQAQVIEEKLNDSANGNYQFKKDEYIKVGKEGYMFPDTYLIPKEASAEAIATKLQNTFESKVSKSLLGKGLKNNLTSYQVLILASLIEREAKTNEERPVIAGIMLNRIKAGIPLQVDATVQYAKGYNAGNKTWWPQVTQEEYSTVKSPYNTYLHQGLPPGPICSPGLDSITAAAQPSDTPYLYYLHDAKGKIHYAKTGEEHNANIQKYL